MRQRSLSSSDEEVRSTPECTSCEEHEAESESVSEKGEYRVCLFEGGGGGLSAGQASGTPLTTYFDDHETDRHPLRARQQSD